MRGDGGGFGQQRDAACPSSTRPVKSRRMRVLIGRQLQLSAAAIAASARDGSIFEIAIGHARHGIGRAADLFGGFG